ncbi:MAG: hypothetical protein EOM31_04105 [Bacteroidia bacterium]|nr:hypothetical protein [Bacteroidia bacterium]
MKKRIIIFLLLGIIAIRLCAQKPRVFLFKEFISGMVLMKNAAKVNALLNYDAANEQMLYVYNNQQMLLSGLEKIDTVYINNRLFIPMEDNFLEYMKGSLYPFFVKWSLGKQMRGRKGAYGQVTQGKVEMINTSYWTNGVYENQSLDVYNVINKSEYRFFINGKVYKFKNKKTFLKCFPEKKEEILHYIHNRHVDFKNIDHVKELYNTIMKCSN